MDTMAWTVSTPVKEEDPLPMASFSKPNVTMSQPCPPYAAAGCSPDSRSLPASISRDQEFFAPDPTLGKRLNVQGNKYP